MTGIQFAVYDFMKRSLVGLPPPKKEKELKEAQLKVRTYVSALRAFTSVSFPKLSLSYLSFTLFLLNVS